MSLLDDTIARAIWDGKLPLHITLHAKNTPAMAQPQEPIYVEVARLSYLTLVTHQLLPVYTGLGLEVQPEQVWYAYEGEPLKWHYPLGLLYDLLTFPASQHTTFGDKACLPWHIDVYFNGFPTDKLLRNPTLDTAQDMYMSMIKEADFLRHGTTKRVMNLSKQDQTQLWQSRIAGTFVSLGSGLVVDSHSYGSNNTTRQIQ
ncbi:autophagy protein Apg5-domain-containing protein [Spinellus fusiger]|nr:autophagy protein Apg5-domain-containing protein [Spinellus fusiger]